MRVSLSKSGRSFSVAPRQPVLDAALAAGLDLPHGCRGGNCGACKARLLQGKVEYPNGPPLGLSYADADEGFVLLCQARAAGDLLLETYGRQTPESVVVKRLPSRIERADLVSHDVLRVFLKVPAAEPFHFEAGQYVDILLPGGRRRSFSIASPPHDSRLLELHVRRVDGGEFTESLFSGEARGKLLTIEGPLGQFVYRSSDAPMLLLGGGTGLAPLMSMMRHVVDNALARQMILYWGVRSERDVYALPELDELARRAASFRYQIILSDPDPGGRRGRGWVHEVALRDEALLGVADIYASGPPAMIAAVRGEFPRHGIDPARIYCDSFDYAVDSLERQRTRAATKS